MVNILNRKSRTTHIQGQPISILSTLLKLIVFVKLAVLPLQTFAGSSEIRGGRGGEPFTLNCKHNEKIGGFQIRMGKVLDGLGIACIPENYNSNFEGDPNIDSFTGSKGGGDYRYNLDRGRKFVKSIQFTACKYKNRTVVRSFRVKYINADGGKGASQTYGKHCSSAHPVITHSAPPGQHIVGITGKSGKYIDALGVIYEPFPVMGRQKRISLDGITAIANRMIFDHSKILLDNYGSYNRNGGHEDNSIVNIAGLVKQFPIKPFSERKKKGIFRVEYYINDFNSKKIYLTKGNKNYLELVVNMENKGREIKGFCRKKIGKKYSVCANNGDILPDGEILSPKFKVQMVPKVFNGSCNNQTINSISFIPTSIHLSGRVQFAGDWKRVPNIIEVELKKIAQRGLNKIVDEVKVGAEKQLASTLKKQRIQCTIAKPIRDYILKNIRGTASVRTNARSAPIRINSVGIDGNDLVVGY